MPLFDPDLRPEDLVDAMSKEEEESHIARHLQVHDKLSAEGRLGPCVRLMPTTTAVQYRTSSTAHVVDGPFAETKEQLLGSTSWTASRSRSDRRRTLAAERAHDIRNPAGEAVLPRRRDQPDSPTARGFELNS
jgi:hypothetical protein